MGKGVGGILVTDNIEDAAREDDEKFDDDIAIVACSVPSSVRAELVCEKVDMWK